MGPVSPKHQIILYLVLAVGFLVAFLYYFPSNAIPIDASYYDRDNLGRDPSSLAFAGIPLGLAVFFFLLFLRSCLSTPKEPTSSPD